METGLYYFKTVVDERSIRKAADQLCVTQQAVSDQLRRLEKRYAAKLYVTRPQFALTLSGEALFETINRISMLEDDLDKRLEEIRDSGIGRIRFGIHASRVRLAFASVMQQFHQEYPRVSVEVIHNDTVNLERMLLDGQLDVAFSLNPENHLLLREIPLGNEGIYVAANAEWLKERLGYLPEQSISAEDLVRLPLIINPQPSNLKACVDAYFEREHKKPEYIVSLMSFEIQLQMAELGIGAAFCPQQVGLQYLRPDQGHGNTRLVFLPAEGLVEKNRLALLTYKNAYLPAYAKRFLALLADAYRIS